MKRALALRDRVQSASVLKVISGIESVPSLPAAYQDVREEIASEDPSLEKIAAIVTRDSGMAAKVLQLVNSSFFGLRREITDPARAVILLGLDTFMGLVLSVHLFQEFKADGAAGAFIERIWQESQAAANLAKAIAAHDDRPKRQREDSYLAGLIHDVGRLVIVSDLPEEHQRIEVAAPELGLLAAEQAALGCNHQDIGGYLIGLWGLPDVIVEAVSFHHNPSAAESREFGALTALNVASAFTRGETEDSELDLGYLDEVGVSDRLAEWRRLGAAIGEEGP